MISRGRVIKGGVATELTPHQVARKVTGDVIPRRVVEAQEQAAAIRTRALAETADLRAQTEHDLHGIREQAVAEGRAQGFAEIMQQLWKVRAHEESFERRSQERIVTIARLLAERVIGRAIELNPTLLADMAMTVLDELRGARQVRLLVHPQDEAHIAPHVTNPATSTRSLTVECDPTLQRGELRVVTDVGSFEAKIGERLDVLCESLKGNGG